MPNPKEYKSVGLTTEAYDKLKYVAAQEDRPLGRQLSRLIDVAYLCRYRMPSVVIDLPVQAALVLHLLSWNLKTKAALRFPNRQVK